jgi:predicted acylesterase/phospholipase RssA
VLNHHTAPRCPVVWAVRMSMSIPLVWNEVVWEAAWGPYLDRDVSGHAIVDGGLLSNFPIELLISDAPEVVRLMGPKRDTEVLGMLIDELAPVPGAPAPGGHGPLDPAQLKMVQRLRRLVDTAMSAHDKMVMDEHEQLVARLPAAGYGVMDFDMSDARRGALVDAGRAALAAHLDARPAAPPRTRVAATAAGATRADRVARRLLAR